MKREILTGSTGGVIGALCCLGPTILILVGVGAFFGITALCYESYRPQFFALGLLFLFTATFIYFKNKKINVCYVTSKGKIKYWAISIVSMIATYAIVIIYIVPYLQTSILGVNSCSV